jgi:hypothetical protein
MHLQQPMHSAGPHIQGPYPQFNMVCPAPIMQQAARFSAPFVPTPSRFARDNEQHHARQEAPQHAAEEEDDLQEVPPTTYQEAATKKKGACRRGKGYEPDEDRVLVSGWLNISKDATVGMALFSFPYFSEVYNNVCTNFVCQFCPSRN